MFSNKFYIFNSKIITHVLFWVVYYVSFSFIWSTDEGLKASFFLEFILLPIRIMAVYVTIYYLLPKFLIKKAYFNFILSYLSLIVVAAIAQRIFIYLFYDTLLMNDNETSLFNIQQLIRASILINTTVFFVLSFKIFKLFIVEKDKNESNTLKTLEIRSDRRTHKVSLNDILFIEGKGNYTTYHLIDSIRITAYGSVKKALEPLPNYFVRVHKSFIVNKKEIKSFDSLNIYLKSQTIPRGKGIFDEDLLL